MAVERYEAKYRPIAKEETSTSIRIVPANELLNRDLNPREVALAEGRVLIPSPAFNRYSSPSMPCSTIEADWRCTIYATGP